MSEIKAVIPEGYILMSEDTHNVYGVYKDERDAIIDMQAIFSSGFGDIWAFYDKYELDKAIEERDILIRDLRKELNERRYGRSASKCSS